MIRHVVVLTFVPGAAPEAIDSIVASLEALPATVPSLRRYTVARDLGIDAGNGDLAICADVDDEAGYLAYRDHPDHLRVIVEEIRPILASRSAAQIPLS